MSIFYFVTEFPKFHLHFLCFEEYLLSEEIVVHCHYCHPQQEVAIVHIQLHVDFTSFRGSRHKVTKTNLKLSISVNIQLLTLLFTISKYTFSKDVMQKYEESKYDQPSDWVKIIIPKILN